MTQLQGAMVALIGVFQKHAGKDQALNKAELKGLLETEFGGVLGDATDKNVVDDVFKRLDQDCSGSVDFTEFVTIVAAITAVTHEMLCQQ